MESPQLPQHRRWKCRHAMSSRDNFHEVEESVLRRLHMPRPHTTPDEVIIKLSLEEVVDTYSKLHHLDTRSVEAVYVDDSVYVVDGKGRVSAVREGDVRHVAKIDIFQNRERFGLTQVAGRLYVMGGVTRRQDDVIERRTDVFLVNPTKQPPLVERICDIMPCFFVHFACRLLVRRDAIGTTPVTGSTS